MSSGRWATVACAVLGLTLAATGVAAAQPTTVDTAPATAVASGDLGTVGAPIPQLEWGSCPPDAFLPPDGPTYECATATVPLSYRNPTGPTIELGVGRLPAADPSRKLGTVFYNPGGPGGSGRIPPLLSQAVHERYDIVGFDPRGVYSSTPLRCFDSTEDSFTAFGSPFPVGREQERAYLAEIAAATASCAERDDVLLDHMSTANVARDLDLLRAAVGEDRLDYYGISYGTHVGAVYVNLFPDRVGRVTLDAVLDPREWTTGERPLDRFVPSTTRLGSAGGISDALDSLLADCAADVRCAFREPGVDLRDKYDGMAQALRENPIELPGPDGAPLPFTFQDLAELTRGSLYSVASAIPYTAFLQQIDDVIGGAEQADPGVSRLAQDALQREPYVGFEQFLGVLCTDATNPRVPRAWPLAARAQDAVTGPGFGSSWTYASLACATWPGTDRDRYTGPWDRETANPVLVIGNGRGDPATPYDDAQATADLLDDATLLTVDVFGHGGAYLGVSECADRAVDSFLIEGTLPAPGTACAANAGTFDPQPVPTRRVPMPG